MDLSDLETRTFMSSQRKGSSTGGLRPWSPAPGLFHGAELSNNILVISSIVRAPMFTSGFDTGTIYKGSELVTRQLQVIDISVSPFQVIKWQSDKKWWKSNQRRDVLTLILSLWRSWDNCDHWVNSVPDMFPKLTPGRVPGNKLDNWESLAAGWNQWLTGDWVSSLHIMTNSYTYSESILQTCNTMQSCSTTKLYIP